ncbi:beta strand repeat-containing protein, partial [Dolichospermum circinale]|uniref:beta strand repeat-containing protein n=1 Tax=Dolichospermum circinale TaxID=109265 RepID=UPI002330B8F2
MKSPGVLTNSGTLTIGGGKKKYLDAKLNNTGNIVGNFLNEILPRSYNLIFQVGSVLNNSGNFKLQSGTIGFLDGAIFNNYGNFELHEVGILNVATGSDIAEGTINNFGTFKKTTIIAGGFGYTNVNFNNKGTVSVEAGTLRLYGGVSDGGIFNINSGKTLIFNSIYTLSNGSKINGDGNLIVEYGIVDLKVSEGATIANTVKLTVDALSGGFHVDGDWTLPTTTNWTSGTFKSTGILTNSGNLNLTDGLTRKLDGQLNNTGKIFHDRGNLELLDGAIFNNSGNYEAKALSGYSISIGGGTFNNSGTYTKTLPGENFIGDFNNTGTVEVRSGTIQFGKIYTHNNAKLILSGGNFIFNRALTINGGSIEGNGRIDVKNIGMTNSGLLNPRLAGNTEFGRLTINSSYTETNSASINIQLGGNIAGTNFDQVDINGTATFDGTLNISLLNNFSPTLGSTFDVLTYDSLSFLSNLNFTGLDINSTLQFLPQWFNNKLTLKVVDKANATNITVTTNQDVVNASDGLLSLREAVIEANQNGLDNTIILGAQTYNLNFSGGSDDNFAATGDLDILPRGGRLTIRGQGVNQTFISTSNLANIFEIHSGATINFQDVTIITSVTLALSSTSVTEDGTSNLVYTFTRAGDSSNALTVNYTVGGTATIGTDYTGIATAGTTKTVTFAAGSSTATVTVDPTADTTVENDETVILTLASGTGYTIGTTSEVTGSITNDDPFTGTPNADTLTGTNGADTLIGLAGNDTYTVNHVGDIVTEALNAGTDLVNASISYTLPNHVENLTLTGSSNINGTGNSLNNTLTGNSGNNTLNGGAGADTLTGGTGSDILVFQFGQSPVSGADRITDFAIGTDKIDLLTSLGVAMNAPTAFTRAANSTATTLTNVVNSVFTDANGALTGNQALGVNSAALVSVTTSGIAGTYLVINDGVAGFQSSNDLLVNITGYSGTLPA